VRRPSGYPTVGLYDLYLNILGGGEKYILSMAEFLAEHCDVELLFNKLVHPEGVTKAELEARLDVQLANMQLRSISLPPIEWLFGRRGRWALPVYLANRKVSANYDLFISTELTGGLPPPTFARHSILVVQAPERRWSPSRYLRAFRQGLAVEARVKLIKRLLYYRFVEPYDTILVYSDFARRNYIREWEMVAGRVRVLSPPVDTTTFQPQESRANRIISVGRFFEGLHEKKHLAMIQAFQRMVDEGLQGWDYVLVGGLRSEDQAYFERVQKAACGYPIRLAPNIPFSDLKFLYETSKVFWHACGYGEDEIRYPEKVEHFGLTTVEAMAAGCVPIVINRGGQREIVRNGLDGLLWNSEDELIACTRHLVYDDAFRRKLSWQAIERSAAFSKAVFQRQLSTIVSDLELTELV